MNKFSTKDVSITKKEIIWQGYFKMIKYYFKHALFNGGTSKLIERELFSRDSAVAVIPFDPISQEVVLIEQIRVGTFEHDTNPWTIEFVAGMVEEGESERDVANRELMEETGLSCQRLQKIMDYLVSPGGTSEKITLYIAQVNASEACKVAGLASESEDIRTLKLNIDDAISLLSQDTLQNGMLIIGLQWLALNHHRISHQWISGKETDHSDTP